MPVLDQILTATAATLPGLRLRIAELEAALDGLAMPRDFRGALRRDTVALIAEVKRRSPSAGALNASLDPVVLAGEYQLGGAAAISVLTDQQFFGGSLADLTAVTKSVSVPALRKDFILDDVQLLEARVAGASAALLIVRALDQARLVTLLQSADALGLAALVEIHNANELDRALDAGAQIIGVNARDLDTFTIDCPAAWRLMSRIPANIIAVAESGMSSAEDVVAAAECGADAVLIGSALATAADPRQLALQLSSIRRHAR